MTASLRLLPALALAAWVFGGLPAPAAADHHEMNPCAAKSLNPCAKKANPCGMKNPCAAKNPCAKKNVCNPCAAKKNPCAGKNVCNPCAGKNPCGAKNPCAGKNPCGGGGGAAVNPCQIKQPAGFKTGGGDPAALLAQGEALWNDTSLSSNGVACATCHSNGAGFMPSFAKPYPHQVAMVKQMSGVDAVNAAEMVQFCMLQPMQAEPLPWSSPKLAALTRYVEHVQQGHSANPCAMKHNPCAGKR
jgi:hypothetical protein